MFFSSQQEQNQIFIYNFQNKFLLWKKFWSQKMDFYRSSFCVFDRYSHCTANIYFQFYYLKIQSKEGNLGRKNWGEVKWEERLLSGKVSWVTANRRGWGWASTLAPSSGYLVSGGEKDNNVIARAPSCRFFEFWELQKIFWELPIWRSRRSEPASMYV